MPFRVHATINTTNRVITGPDTLPLPGVRQRVVLDRLSRRGRAYRLSLGQRAKVGPR